MDKAPHKTISIKTIQIYEVDNEKKNPILVRKSIQINNGENEGENGKNLIVDYNLLDNKENQEGKLTLQKYISNK